jgi:hypothetical protein
VNIGAARILTDPDTVRRRLGRMPSLRSLHLGGARARAFWVKPGRHFNACYGLCLPGERSDIAASGFVLGASLEAVSSRWQAHECGGTVGSACGACSTFADEAGLLWQLFPFDYRLPALRDCLDATRVGRHLNGGGVARCIPVGYRPGMRCQIRYELADRSVAFGKIAVERVPGDAFRRHARLSQQLVDAGAKLRLPPALTYVEELGLSVIAAAGGDSLHRCLRQGRGDALDIERIAVALARLHELDLEGIERAHRPSDELELLAGWITFVGALFPELDAPLRRRQADLLSTRPADTAGRALIHRDFYDKQILLSGNTIVLLDMDTACRGDAEIDLGNFCAHLELRALQWKAPGAFADLGHVLLNAYPLDANAERVSWYRAAALLRLACVYALRPHWRLLAPALITIAEPR